ncbi:MAG: [Fe-Fe] hydrogenase large subunit C-terminal domain-containing protein [Candidatus Delongbacteria bacterium]
MSPTTRALIRTIPERCRTCYTCVRECPAKAIRIMRGQAEVLPERCVGCGNCVLVCRQQAKQIAGSLGAVRDLLASGEPVGLLMAPSFPAEFGSEHSGRLLARLRRLGFAGIWEVAFGADLVARAYRELLEDRPAERWIATTCPAIVFFVEKYHPDLVPALAPIVSPMTAMARVVRRLNPDPRLHLVFAGPCVAKKAEAAREGEVEEVLTFRELRELLEEQEGLAEMSRGLEDGTSGVSENGEFDPPLSGLGRLFPVSRGMLQTAGLHEDLLDGTVVAVDGRRHAVEALQEFESHALDTRLLECLSCNGCIMGAGISAEAPLFRRRAAVGRHARERMAAFDPETHRVALVASAEISLERGYRRDDQRLPPPSPDELKTILARLGKRLPQDELDCGACGYESCQEHAVAIHRGLAESEMCLPWVIERLRHSLNELGETGERLAVTRQALVNAEKLASMGQLSAGIAHEINNPLGVILLYGRSMLDELEIASGHADSPGAPAGGDASERASRREDLEMIVEQAERCRKIVAGLLNFARRSRVVLQATDLGQLLRHAFKALRVPELISLQIDTDSAPQAEVDPDQLVQVITNLVNNAVEAMPAGGRLQVGVRAKGDEAVLWVRDSGTGIPEALLERIFEPLFTTKQIGKGTGLGLAVTYGIVKMHRGRIEVDTNTDATKGPVGTEFRVILPCRRGEDGAGSLEGLRPESKEE